MTNIIGPWNATPQFVHLLNAMENAGAMDAHSDHGYGDKRKALIAYGIAQEKRIAELERSAEALTDGVVKSSEVVADYARQVAELERQLAEAGKDADRYVWLRDNAFGANGHLALLPPDQMNIKVDQAMKESK